MVASSIASKGLDFSEIQHVINFSMPKEIEVRSLFRRHWERKELMNRRTGLRASNWTYWSFGQDGNRHHVRQHADC